jgi:hypothetical protein
MKVYKYGARPPADGGTLIREQMALGHRYYNALVRAENDRRANAWYDGNPPGPPHSDCDCDVCERWQPPAPPPPHPNEKDQEACKCAACKAHWQGLVRAVREAPPLDLKPLRTEFRARGLFWGTYLAIEQAFNLAWKKRRATKRVKFRSRRKGSMVCGIQVMKDKQTDPSTLFRIQKTPDPRTGRRAQNGRGRYAVQIRVGSKGRDPIWSEPMGFEMHRLIEGVVTWVHVRVRRVADREIWSVAFSCRGTPARDDEAPRGVVAVDVSWRKIEDRGVRIAYAQDADANVDELILSPGWEQRSIKADEIQSVRDRNLNALKEADPRFARVKSWAGVRRLMRAIDDPGDLVKSALRRDRHLWQYEMGLRRRSTAHRRDTLRKWIRDLRRRYAFVVVKDSAHKEMKEDKTKVADGGLTPAARRRGQHAAPGETVEQLCQVFDRDVGVGLVAAPETTATCIEPGCDAVSAHGPELIIQCERCGHEHDRDLVSTRNMLRAHARGDWWRPTARKKTARFAKRHRNGKEGDNASPTA